VRGVKSFDSTACCRPPWVRQQGRRRAEQAAAGKRLLPPRLSMCGGTGAARTSTGVNFRDNPAMNSVSTPPRLSMFQVLLCGAAIVTLSMGIRHGFGLWLQPITMERGWTRETFAFALAVQNLAWGLAGPVAGALADRFGAWKVIVVGSVFYAAGLVLMALATSGLAFTGSAGVLLGIAQSGTTYTVI
jgi:MFS family permease